VLFTYTEEFEPIQIAGNGYRIQLLGCREVGLNAAINILSREFAQLGVVYSEATPVETALPMFNSSKSPNVVDVKRVVESGSPTLKHRTALAMSE
jgi:hypothetical protein